MTNIARTLPRLQPHHDALRIDRSESVDDYFSLDGLNRIDDYRDRSRIKLFEGLTKDEAIQHVSPRDARKQMRQSLNEPAVYSHPRSKANIQIQDANDTTQQPSQD